MANRRGRPTREETEAKMKMEYNPDVKITNEGLLLRPSTVEGNVYKFEGAIDFVNYLYIKLKDTFGGPMQPVLMNFGILSKNDYNTKRFYETYNRTQYLTDGNLNQCAWILENEFSACFNHREEVYGDISKYAYHFKIKLDLRRIKHNLSFVYQLISDVHNKLFGYFLGVYLFETAAFDWDPIATLHIIISNPAVEGNKLVSYNTGNKFIIMAEECRHITNMLYNVLVDQNHPKYMPVVKAMEIYPELVDKERIKEFNEMTARKTKYVNAYEALMQDDNLYCTTPPPISKCKPTYLKK